MEITFKSKKLRKQLSEDRKLQQVHGPKRAKRLKKRLKALHAAQSLGDFLPPYSGAERCHELSGNRAGQLSMDLDHPYRLIFCPDHDPVPQTQDGGLDWEQVVAVHIIAVEDPHD